MGSDIVQTNRNITLVGAGPVNKEVLAIALTHAPYLVAVDGGAEMVRNCGSTANFLLGDLDSVSEDTKRCFGPEKTWQSSDQETTDLEKAMSMTQAPTRIGVGFLGGRADHHLSAIRVVAQARPGALVLISEDDVVFRVPKHLVLPAAKGTRVSLFPVDQARVDARCLRWPINDAAMSFGAFVSQSNTLEHPPLDIHAMGRLVAVMPLDCLSDVIRVLQPDAPADALSR